jgi:hypothetical protein
MTIHDDTDIHTAVRERYAAATTSASCCSPLDSAQIPVGLDLRATKPRTTAPKETHMPVVRVYEPALCCNTGVCGEDVDQWLVTFTADLTALADQGADITRHNLANDPMAFASNESVRAFLNVAGSEGLPLTTVDGVTVMTGAYPRRDQLARFAGLQTEVPVPVGATLLQVADETSDADSACGPSGCC